ncbi:MAG: AAA family ATPase [Crocinitomix sp.]|nr:AAA family ATPase [Crocinitomix sp.]
MSKRVVGRVNELKVLTNTLSSRRSELIAVYGRRRIGKTYLIREFFGNKIEFSFTGLEVGNRADQIENFMLKLNEFTNDRYENEKPVSWLAAFTLLKKYLKTIKVTKTKKVIFIDEFPWTDSPKSRFLPAFENFWNDYCTTRTDLVVVVCGSAASYMMKKIIRNKGGLHNRITQRIELQPFTLHETEAFFKYKDNPVEQYDLLKMYMAFGGVAEYLEHVNTGESSVQAIDRMCFSNGGFLENEYADIFNSLYGQNSYHEQIIHVLATARKKGLTRTDLLKKTNISTGGQFSKSLEELILSGFVLKYDSYREKSKTTLYRIYDEFCLFHLQFMIPYRGSKWTSVYQKQEYRTWCGYAFETICLKHIKEIKKGLECDQIESKNYTWSSSKAQVDLVVDRDDKTVNLCEIKYYGDEYELDASDLKKLRNRETQFRESKESKKGLKTAVITTWGVKQNQYSNAIVRKIVTMKSLFIQA